MMAADDRKASDVALGTSLWINAWFHVPQALFAPSNGEAKMSWAPLDDVVMGGCSISSFQVEKGAGEDGLSSAGVFRHVPDLGMSRCFSFWFACWVRVFGLGNRSKLPSLRAVASCRRTTAEGSAAFEHSTSAPRWT